MPVSRYQLRNEYSLADPELYGAADRDDSEAVLEGVAMAGLVGVLRQLGDLAEFAAGIFHDLHEEVMTTAARGHGLTIRVQQLEADFPSIEKAILSQTNHSRFTYNAGIEWRAGLRLDQNLITQGDFPRFIMDSYEECRGPPRLFLLDKFDIAGTGACLKRYSDPSTFKTEFGMKRVEVKREKKVRKVKKKGRPWWNEEPPEIFTASDFNARLHKLASDENNVSEKPPSHGVKLKRRHLNGCSLNSRTGKSYMECILEMRPPISFPELNEIGMDDLPKRLLYKEKTPVQSHRQDVFELPMVDLGKNVLNSGYVYAKPIPIAKYEADEISSAFNQAENDLLADGKSTIEVSASGYRSNEFEIEKIPTVVRPVDQKDALVDRGSVATSGAEEYRSEDATSELENYMDALTAMESEMDTDIKVKHELGFSNDLRQVDSNMTDEQQELYAQHLDAYSVKNFSVASQDWSGSFENQESSHSDLDNMSSSDLQTSLGNEIASLDMPGDHEVLSPSEQTVLGLTHNKPKTGGEVAFGLYSYQIRDMSSEKLSSTGDILGSESLQTSLPNVTGNDVCEAPRHVPELGVGESPSTSITGSSSTCSHSSLETSLNEIQPDKLDPAEVLLGCLEVNGESPSNPDEVGKQVGENILHAAGISNFPSEINEGVHSTQFTEICSDGSSNALLQLSDILDWSCGMKNDDGVSKAVFPTEYVEDCSAAEIRSVKTLGCISDDLPVIDACDLPSGKNDASILEEAPVEYVEEGPSVENSFSGKIESSNLMEEPDILTKQYQDVSSGGTLPETHSTIVQTVRYSLVIENGILPNENSEYSSPAIDLQVINGFGGESDKITIGSISLKSQHFYDAELLDSHVEDLGELPTECSGMEASPSNRQESLSNAPGSEVKNDTVREGNCSRSFTVMENSSLHVDLSLLPTEPNFTVEALPVEACTQSDDVGTRCILVANNLDDCVHEPISSPIVSSNHRKVQDECFSGETVPDLFGQQSNESSNQEDLRGSQNELNPPVVGYTGLDLVPCTLDSPDASGFLASAHHLVQSHLHPSNDNSETSITLTESDQESKLKSPQNEEGDAVPTSFHLEAAITSEQETATVSEQASDVHAVSNLSTVSKNEEGCGPECSDLQFERAESLEQMGSPHDSKEGMPSPCHHELDSGKLPTCSPNSSTSAALAPIFPAINLPNADTINQVSFEQRPYPPIIGFPLTETSPLQANLDEMPPLPPLPPLEWRTGKPQYGSLFWGQETIRRQSSFPQLPVTENQNAQGFSTMAVSPESHYPSAPLPAKEDGASQHIFHSLFGEIPQHSKSLTPLPAEEAEKPQHGFFTLGKEMVPPRSSSAPLPILQEDKKDDKPQDSSQPATVVGKSQHMLQTSVSEMPQPPNSFARPPTFEVEKPQYGLSILGGKMVPPQSSSAPLPSVEFEEDNKRRDASPTIEGKMLQPLRSYVTPPIAKDEKTQHGSFASNGERTEPSNPFSSLPIVEDEKPNGDVQPKPTRPRDPFVEAVAFHDRTMLRNVSERIRREVKPKADERDSLLEQIRSKVITQKIDPTIGLEFPWERILSMTRISFNLRPAVMKKPSLQGPKTNLNVVAILEKANSIRQAFVGSDEDDEDGWSDS